MLIRTSDKRKLVDMSGMTLRIAPEMGEKIEVIAYGNNQPADTFEKLGSYDTEQRAIELLDEICNAYQYCNESYVCIGATQPEFVFQMPEE